MVKLLVTMAVEAEFAPWRSGRGFQAAVRNDVPVFVGRFRGADVDVLLTGIGRARAARRASRVLAAGGYDLVISSGLAGALDASLAPGSVLAARTVLAEQGGLPRAADADALRTAAARGARLVDAFCTTERILLRAGEKSRLARGTRAAAVEMESYDVLEAAALARVPAVAIRAVSDTAGEDLPVDFNRAVTPEGGLSLPRLLGELLRHPLALAGLVSFAGRSRRAAESLAGFLAGYVIALASPEKQAGTARAPEIPALAGD